MDKIVAFLVNSCGLFSCVTIITHNMFTTLF